MEQEQVPRLKTTRWVHLVFLTGIATITIRGLLDSRYGTGTILYLLVPFAISIALNFLTKPTKRASAWWNYVDHLRLATIIFFATSAFLFEGFLCVLMFMPIYYAMATIGFAFDWFLERKDKKSTNKLGAYAIPAVVLLLATEGMLPSTTIPRDRDATYVAVTNQDIATLKRNMALPITFPAKRHWFLRLFPLPDEVHAGSLKAGDIHRLHFTYKKWFISNFTQGEMLIRIAAVEPQYVRTEIIRNTSYLSHYMVIKGTEIYFTPMPNGHTRVALTVKYRRLLDPAWYFGPMQQMAAEQSARYFFKTIIERQPPEVKS